MSGPRIAIVQSSYIPWKGYFDLIRGVDEFVLYDDVQFTRRDWRSRNRIKTPEGPMWLTVPVAVKGRFTQRIRETEIADARWAANHWQNIRRAYGRAPFFARYEEALAALFSTATDRRLSVVNHHFITGLCALLGITTRITWSMDYTLEEERTARLVGICRQAGAREYVSGPAARDYIDAGQFARAGITLSYADYGGYAEYPQLYPPFEHAVSVIDLLVHAGPDALRYMKDVAPRG